MRICRVCIRTNMKYISHTHICNDGYLVAYVIASKTAVGNNVDEKERDNVQWSIFIFMKRWKRVQHTGFCIYINFLPHNYRRVPKIQVCVTLKLSSTLDFYPIHMCVILFCYLILPKGKLRFYVYFSPYFRYSALKTSFVYIYMYTKL